MRKKQILKGIVYFFAGMCICTLIAKQASAMTVAKVYTETMKSGGLVKKIEGSGEIVAADRSFQSLPEGQKIGKILVKTGTKVEKGTAVIQLDMEYLNQKLTEQRREVEKVKLELEQQKLTAKHELKQYETTEEGEADVEEKKYQKQLASLQQDTLQLTLKSQREQLERLETFQRAKGVLYSEHSGMLETINATEGAVTTGAEQIVLENGSQEVCGLVSDTALGTLKEGMEVAVLVSGDSERNQVIIERFGVNEEGNTVWYGKLPAQEEAQGYRTKTKITYIYEEKTLGEYEKLIPLTALREEKNSAYVLITEVRDGILGEQYMAKKVSVTVIDRDEEYAAVQTSMPSDARIITGTNKYVEDGDRVRLEE